MTLSDLRRLLLHYWKVVVTASVACATAAALLSMCISPKYEASASIVASDLSGNVPASSMVAIVNELVQSRVAPYEMQGSDIKASTSIGAGATSQTITLSIEGPNESECVELANSIAADAVDDATAFFDSLQEANKAELADLDVLSASEDVAAVLSGSLLQDVLGSSRTFEFCSFVVGEAVRAENVGIGSMTLTLLGFAAGLFLSTAFIIAIDIVRMPIKTREESEAVSGAVVLCANGLSNLGDKLWANIQFVADGAIDSICLVPLGGDSARDCAEALEPVIARQGKPVAVCAVDDDSFSAEDEKRNELTVYCCAPLSQGIGAAYCSHYASATVICARFWDDSLRDLKSVVHELSLAKANVVGIALLKSRKDGAA